MYDGVRHWSTTAVSIQKVRIVNLLLFMRPVTALKRFAI
jgi:hypothetical protein